MPLKDHTDSSTFSWNLITLALWPSAWCPAHSLVLELEAIWSPSKDDIHVELWTMADQVSALKVRTAGRQTTQRQKSGVTVGGRREEKDD